MKQLNNKKHETTNCIAESKLGFTVTASYLTHYKSCGTTQTYLLRPLHLVAGLGRLVAGGAQMLYYA